MGTISLLPSGHRIGFLIRSQVLWMFGINRDLLYKGIFRKKDRPNNNLAEVHPAPASMAKAPLMTKLDYVSSLDFSQEDLERNREVIIEGNHEAVRTVNWFIPHPTHILYGGIYTILRFANYFQENSGIQNRLIFCGAVGSALEALQTQISAEFPALAGAEFYFYDNQLDSLPSCDASIATLWNTCFISVKFNRTKKKFYFIQDYEPLFSAAGTVHSALAEATYRLGFRGIVNTPGLYDFMVKEHDLKGLSFHPCVDRKIFCSRIASPENETGPKPTRIVFYGRPTKDRNGFEICLAALLEIKNRYQDRVEIMSVGDDWEESDYGVEGRVKNLGRIQSLSAVADIYRRSDIGVVMMFTKHPSYQPFEFMASGCAVVSNINPANSWFLKDRKNCLLSEPTPSCLAQSISELVENPKLRRELILQGAEAVRTHNWDEECRKVSAYLNS